MRIRNIFTIVSILFSSQLFATIDSAGVQNNKGKKLIIHRVEASETYFSLGRRYGVDPKAIMDFNDNIPLKIGTVLNIPTNRPFNESEEGRRAAPAVAKITFQRHRVRAGETLSEIAEQYNTSVNTLKRLNNLRGTTIGIGQSLKVKQITTSVPQPEPARPVPIAVAVPDNTNVSDSNSINLAAKANPARYGLQEKSEQGMATWLEDDAMEKTKLLVMHRTAPVGTVMKITNPATEKSTFAKVAGQITENEAAKDVIIILTKAVADLIGAPDKKFQVSIDYGVSE